MGFLKESCFGIVLLGSSFSDCMLHGFHISLSVIESGCSAFSECQNISVFAKIEVGFCFILFLAC